MARNIKVIHNLNQGHSAYWNLVTSHNLCGNNGRGTSWVFTCQWNASKWVKVENAVWSLTMNEIIHSKRTRNESLDAWLICGNWLQGKYWYKYVMNVDIEAINHSYFHMNTVSAQSSPSHSSNTFLANATWFTTTSNHSSSWGYH